MSIAVGTRLGVYEILAPIGAGGMGEVYRARDSRLNRDVALKVLPPSVADDPDRLARFRREAQVLASLNHPNIAQIYGFEEMDPSTGSGQAAVQALVMELVPGPTLAELIEGRRNSVAAAGSSAVPRGIGIDDALRIGRQIAEGLEVAHEQGIIHRDLKPANIKVRDDGMVKVLDFGLAKALDPASREGSADAMNSPTLTVRSTQLGVVLGTAAYMAPEQAKGRPVDRRADIWAFGVVLYEMLSGRRGYEAEDISDTLAAVLTREVEWAALPIDTPPRLRALLRDCLVRDPKQRLRDIGEARRTLDQLIAGGPESGEATIAPPPSVASPPAMWKRALPWTIAAVAVLIAAGVSWKRLEPSVAIDPVVTRSRIELKEVSGFVDVSRDGTKAAYTVSGAQGLFLALRQMDQFDGKPIPGAEGAQFPVFSPDAQWIAYGAPAGKIRTASLVSTRCQPTAAANPSSCGQPRKTRYRSRSRPTARRCFTGRPTRPGVSGFS